MINQHDPNPQIEWRFLEAKLDENWTNMISTPQQKNSTYGTNDSTQAKQIHKLKRFSL